MSKKRKRDRTAIDGQLVEIYEDLAHENDDIRLKAAQTLLSRIASEQEPSRTQLVTHVLIRLIRGLCSGRRTARLGFSVALTEFLVQTQNGFKDEAHAQVDVQDVIDALMKHSTAGGNVSGQVVISSMQLSVADNRCVGNPRSLFWALVWRGSSYSLWYTVQSRRWWRRLVTSRWHHLWACRTEGTAARGMWLDPVQSSPESERASESSSTHPVCTGITQCPWP